MKILHISTDDSEGGAARAAFRIHRALAASGVDSRMRVMCKRVEDERIVGSLGLSRRTRAKLGLLRRWQQWRSRGWQTPNPVLHTFGGFGAGLVDELNACDADVLNLHWISDLLSIKDIGRLKKPIVWTLHDMWPFCGGEHYAPDGVSARFRQGYREDNRPAGESGPDLNRQSWDAKGREWSRQSFTFVCPSRWMADCVRHSRLFSAAPVEVIPYPMEMEALWRVIPREVARTALALPSGKKLVLMVADRGLADPRKGGDLLREAIGKVAAKCREEIELIVCGQGQPAGYVDWPCKVHWLGVVSDDRVLALVYAAADVVVVPSRQDNLPNTALEAQACATPVVAFDVGGLPDIVVHRQTGWLAKPEDPGDFADGILWVLTREDRGIALSSAARQNAEACFTEAAIAFRYVDLYRGVLSRYA